MLVEDEEMESKNQGTNINCKETKHTIVNQWNSPRCRARIEDIDIKQVRKFKYLSIVLTGKEKRAG